MFKKFGKSTLDSIPDSHFQDLEDRPSNPFATDLMNAPSPRHPYATLQEEASSEEEPETTLAPGVSIKGTMTFEKLLRVDGSFEGELVSSGKIIVGPTGSVQANLDLEEAYIAGKVVGNITVKKRLVLRGRAEVRGDITAPLISVDEGVSIVGILNVSQEQSPSEASPE